LGRTTLPSWVGIITWSFRVESREEEQVLMLPAEVKLFAMGHQTMVLSPLRWDGTD
jgi:hypothetical protein